MVENLRVLVDDVEAVQAGGSEVRHGHTRLRWGATASRAVCPARCAAPAEDTRLEQGRTEGCLAYPAVGPAWVPSARPCVTLFGCATLVLQVAVDGVTGDADVNNSILRRTQSNVKWRSQGGSCPPALCHCLGTKRAHASGPSAAPMGC